ncbi:MAG: LysM peptidoglycan-binding domain-containing protein [Lentisphaerae bacterium]|nr:LysM peptidoglycan-binding domain-containing protein [Lentisphaerota bacterium]
MQKKMVGILAGVAAAHAVLLVSMMAGGGCRQPEILGPHTYNNGPEFAEVPAPSADPAPTVPTQVPTVENNNPLPPPVEVKPPVQTWNDPVPPPVAVKQPEYSGTTTYKVKKGDSLSRIAFKHGVSLSALAACNNLSGKAMNKLYIGQELTIPKGGVYNPDRKMKKRPAAVKSTKKTGKKAKGKATPKAAAPMPADGMYTVKSGDTLDRIGRRYGVTGAAIAKANNISLNKVLHIGDKLRLPGAAPAPATTGPAPKNDTISQDAAPIDNSNQDLVDSLDPSKGMSDAAVPTTPAAPATDTAAATADTTTAPAAASASDSSSLRTESFEIHSDTTVEKFCSEMNITVEQLRQLNKNLPADGQLKTGTYVVIPSM